jgi:predicted RNA binding protein YcfA (HicA-like mRNA interferase family)
MSYSHLNSAIKELPIVFEPYALPEMVEEFHVIPCDDINDNTSSQLLEIILSALGDQFDTEFSASDSTFSLEREIERWLSENPLRLPSVVRSRSGRKPQPLVPDEWAFYLPFHYFYPDLWGVYVTFEGIYYLALQIRSTDTGRFLSLGDCLILARQFLYEHEHYHHCVESFAMRLEVTHRMPLFKNGFEQYYKDTKGTKRCLEESLANAYAAVKAPKKVFDYDVLKQRNAGDAIREIIENSPPGYRESLDYIGAEFKHGEYMFAEKNQRYALPHLKPLAPEIWGNFGHSFHGFITSRSPINYLVHQNSPILSRIKLDTLGRLFTAREVKQRLQKLGCSPHPKKKKRGGHVVWQSPHAETPFDIPIHPGELCNGTVKKIFKDAGFNYSLSDIKSMR